MQKKLDSLCKHEGREAFGGKIFFDFKKPLKALKKLKAKLTLIMQVVLSYVVKNYLIDFLFFFIELRMKFIIGRIEKK